MTHVRPDADQVLFSPSVAGSSYWSFLARFSLIESLVVLVRMHLPLEVLSGIEVGSVQGFVFVGTGDFVGSPPPICSHSKLACSCCFLWTVTKGGGWNEESLSLKIVLPSIGKKAAKTNPWSTKLTKCIESDRGIKCLFVITLSLAVPFPHC